ncbi:molybdenum cofactor guanylyltransferase MobA [Rhodobium gokarnense]|uniref:Molybdenum cofactor guanylyltransferase n=1 Tax=Rhodobium gokarnense TaxID=364296 RepID=A0ABT3HGH5_9HYPH|nr:molybdenum cofactor guanylyltransferase MobA [Rhodobium gokarnense]MCW2309501.1 molybdopterin-guanine dinucleotide biosynthesis protein A [Rhodobium gokarnense]
MTSGRDPSPDPSRGPITGLDETLLNDPARYAPIVAGCVLAGGKSRRMGGGDKGLLDLGGRPILAHVVERLAPQVGALALNANGDPARFADFDLPVIADPVEGFVGPLAGILAGMLWAREAAPKASFLVTAAGDTPFFPKDLVARLVGAAGYAENLIGLAVSGERLQPVFGLWPLGLADDLQAWLTAEKSRKVQDWVAHHTKVEVRFSGPLIDGIEIDPFFNINAPEDKETAEAVLEGLTA